MTEETKRSVDEHNDALGDEAKRGKEDVSKLIAKEPEKGLLPNIYMTKTV